VGNAVEIGPYAVVGPGVTIGDGTVVGPHVLVECLTTIGRNCKLYKGASVGTNPQDLKYAGEETTLEIGDNTTVREFCTLNRGTTDRKKTTVGANCLLMAYAHVAHDCSVGDNVIIANAVQMGGHVTIEEYAIIGGGVPIHQFTHIGRHSIVGGGYRAVQDVPPYIRAAGEPLRYIGVNSIGLSRRGFSDEAISTVKKAYRSIFRSQLKKAEALEKIKQDLPQTDEVKNIVTFIQASQRGII
jgi:UDP-N-acetylglucosamine acyltransferase